MTERMVERKEWQGYAKGPDGEIQTVDLVSKTFRDEREVDAFTPATPARITPSRRKSVDRDYKSIFVFGDAQIDYRRVLDHETQQEELVPTHDERALKIARFICRDLRPDTIINLGDTIDLAALSRFKPDSDHFHRTLGPAFQRVHNMYAELRADNPDAKIVEVDSNHNTRLKDFVLKNMPQLYNVKQAGAEADEYPVMSYPYLANLKHVGVDWVSGYGAAEYEYNDDLAFIHGTMATSNGSTAAKLSKANPDRNIIQGHAHRVESQYRTTRHGKQLGAFVVGALCRTTGEVPSYHSAVDDMGRVVRYQEDWQNSVMAINDYGDGNYEFNHILINNGQAYYKGNFYSADNTIDNKNRFVVE